VAYKEALYRLTRVRRTGLTISRGIDSSPQGSPPPLASAGRRRGQRSNLLGAEQSWDRYRVCGGCEGTAGPRRAKTSSLGRKKVLGLLCGSADEGEGEETSGSENKTRLDAVRLLGREPGGLPRQRRLPGVASAAVEALRRLMATTSSRDRW
jgi:hypothetical protein